MKLNLLIFFLLGVSVSASGIRGFTPIKGRERRLKSGSSSSSSSKSKSKSDDADVVTLLVSKGLVRDCSGDSCEKIFEYCPGLLFKSISDSGSTSKKSSKTSSSRRVRRLAKTSSSSKSKSSSDDSSDDDAEYLFALDVDLKELMNCDLSALTLVRAEESSSSSSSSSSSKKSSKSRRE